MNENNPIQKDLGKETEEKRISPARLHVLNIPT